MSKSVNKSSAASEISGTVAVAIPAKMAAEPKSKKTAPSSKQSRVVALLSSPGGTTIAAMMKATGWQQHSVRGFLAGVVCKKLKLKLDSKKIDGQRVYRIPSGGKAETGKRSKRRAA